MHSFIKWARNLVRSIASLPTIIFLAFVVLAFLQLATTDGDHQLPDWLSRFDIQDLNTIRTILAAVVTGVFTLTIFAYTMVMSVIDRSISSYSPRLLPLILGERYHQEILGVGAGTIAHSVILLLGVADPPDAAHPPLLSAASSGLFAVGSLVLFLYFIHRVSRSIHINVLLRKSFEQTARQLRAFAANPRIRLVADAPPADTIPDRFYRSEDCGYLDEVDLAGLCRLSSRAGVVFHLLPRSGTFVRAGQPIVGWTGKETLDAGSPQDFFEVSANEPVDTYATGFRHLVEVSIKAASPAINDPATAMTAINYLGELFRQLAEVGPHHAAEDPAGPGRVYLNEWAYPELLQTCFRELRCYLGADPWGVQVMRENLTAIAEACTRTGNSDWATAAGYELEQLQGKPD